MSQISRRTVAKGAAWSIPTITVAASSPAIAASGSGPTSITACPQGTAFSNTGVGSQSAIVVGDGTYAGGSYITFDTGQIQIPAATGNDGSSVTGFYILWKGAGQCSCSADNTATGPEFTITTADGGSHKGRVTYSGTTGCSPQVAGAGFAGNIGVQTNIPYPSDTVCFVPQNARIKSMSVPFTLVYLNGTTPIGCCNYTATYTFDDSGCMPFTGTGFSVAYTSGN